MESEGEALGSNHEARKVPPLLYDPRALIVLRLSPQKAGAANDQTWIGNASLSSGVVLAV